MPAREPEVLAPQTIAKRHCEGMMPIFNGTIDARGWTTVEYGGAGDKLTITGIRYRDPNDASKLQGSGGGHVEQHLADGLGRRSIARSTG